MLENSNTNNNNNSPNLMGYFIFQYGKELFKFLFLFFMTTCISLLLKIDSKIIESIFEDNIFSVSLVLFGCVFVLFSTFIIPYILCELILIDRGCVEFNLTFNMFLTKHKNIDLCKKHIKSISDNVIIKHIKKTYKKYLIIISNIITILIYNPNNKFIKDISSKIVSSMLENRIEEVTLIVTYIGNYIIPFVIIYSVLKIIVLNKTSIKNSKLFNIYREKFEYKEEDYREEFFFKMRKSNTIIFYICLILYILTFARYIKIILFFDIIIFLIMYLPISRYFYLKLSKKYEDRV